MSDQVAHAVEGWHPDPFGRHETRFHDGTRWTPYVKDGEAHSLDEPVEAVETVGTGPELLTADLLVVELPADRAEACSVFGRDGRDLGAVRRVPGEESRLEIVGGDGTLVLGLTTVPGRKPLVVVRDARGFEMGRLVQQHLPGLTTYALESTTGVNVGYVRARTWVGWDVRVEDERNRPVARVSKMWDGLDRDAVPAADAYVVRFERGLLDPQRALVRAAALVVDAALKKDTRGFQ